MAYQNLSFVDYRDQFFETTDHLLLDVRTPMEFMRGHVPGAINIPLHELYHRLHEIPHTQPIIVICATGNRSMDGASVLANADYQQVYNLQGGTMVWMMNGLLLEA
jgi:rhodanese-related sulfurtransferase